MLVWNHLSWIAKHYSLGWRHFELNADVMWTRAFNPNELWMGSRR